jgi:hypothetical protein
VCVEVNRLTMWRAVATEEGEVIIAIVVTKLYNEDSTQTHNTPSRTQLHCPPWEGQFARLPEAAWPHSQWSVPIGSAVGYQYRHEQHVPVVEDESSVR